MAGVKISALPPGGEIQNNDLLPVARGSATYSVQGSVIFPVTEPKMGNNSVSNRALSANVVSLDKIRTIPGNRLLGNNTDTQGNVAAVQVVEGMIADDAVTSVKIKEGEVKDANILNNTISLGKLQQISANRVLGATIAGNVVQTQVTEGIIANDAVTSAKIKEGEVKTANLADGAVNRNKIATNEVMFTNLQQIGPITNSVIGYTSANTNAQAVKVVNDMISNLTITGDKIANSTITSDKLAFSIPAQVAPIPAGGIIMWSGTNVPTGWALCNGQNGTPDLRDRFIVGAGSTYAVGATGGVNTVTLTVSQIPSHTHSASVVDPGHTHGLSRINGQTGLSNAGGNDLTTDGPTNVNLATDSRVTGISVTVGNAGEGQSHENRPPYYALAFIMKL